jgi:uncharacterized protein with FMN-binding domain
MSRFTVVLAAASLIFSTCMRAEINSTRAMTINDVEISKIRDGSYTGSYEYGGFTYSVRCVVSQGRVDKIKILQNRATKHALQAEAVIPKIIEQQKVTVDAVTGATASSKALLKAVERALAKGVPGTAQ